MKRQVFMALPASLMIEQIIQKHPVVITLFTWGAGVRLAPLKNWSFDTSYEFLRNPDAEKTEQF
ncbi:TPA: hypothetical protein ACH2I9_004164 [Enterobacter asburiae]